MLCMIIDMTKCASANMQFVVGSISINGDNVKSASGPTRQLAACQLL